VDDRLQNGTKVLTKDEHDHLVAAFADGSYRDGDPVFYAKFFDPYATNWTWYACGFDEADGIFEGYVEGYANEWGSWCLSDLTHAIRGMKGIGIERDLYFTPCRYSELGR
jgi:hypothetical protein